MSLPSAVEVAVAPMSAAAVAAAAFASHLNTRLRRQVQFP